MTTSELGPLTKASLAVGELTISLAIVLYDLRNSQHYNSAVGRAEHLEAIIGFDRFGSDQCRGLFGSRRDTTHNMKSKGLDHFLGLSIRHSQTLALVYTAVIGAWIWAVFHQVAVGAQRVCSDNWFQTAPHGQWVALVAAFAATAMVFLGYRRHDRPSQVGLEADAAPEPGAASMK